MFLALSFAAFFPFFVVFFAPPFTPTFSGDEKTGFEFQRISIDRTKMSEEEAFEHAIEMIQTRQMGFRKAADFFSVSSDATFLHDSRNLYTLANKQEKLQKLIAPQPLISQQIVTSMTPLKIESSI